MGSWGGVSGTALGAGPELKGFTSAHQPPASCLFLTALREEDEETPSAPAEPPTRAPLLLQPKRDTPHSKPFQKAPVLT